MVALVAFATGMTACGDADDDTGTATTSSSASPATAPADTEPFPSSSVGAAPCTSEAILPVVQGALDSPDIAVASVDVTDCQNGYARAIAVPTGENQQSEQVFLRDDDGTWVVVGYGTGIDCADPTNLDEADLAACEALGLTP